MKLSKLLVCFAVFAGLLLHQSADAQTTVAVRGTITDFDGGKLLGVKTREGKDVKITLADKLVVNALSATSAADIKPGNFIGTAAARRPDG